MAKRRDSIASDVHVQIAAPCTMCFFCSLDQLHLRPLPRLPLPGLSLPSLPMPTLSLPTLPLPTVPFPNLTACLLHLYRANRGNLLSGRVDR